MGTNTKPGVLDAKAEWMAAPKNDKPAALALARKHGVAESTIHRARAGWIKEARKLARAAAPRKAISKESANG